jgi:CHRD domain
MGPGFGASRIADELVSPMEWARQSKEPPTVAFHKLIMQRSSSQSWAEARGSGDFTYDDTSKKLTWTITYRGFRDKAKSAHLHGPASEGANANTMITVSPLQSPIKGAAILTEEQVKALTGGDMYIDVHSAKYPDGEIRGQLKPAS